MNLTGLQYKQLRDALVAAFPNPGELAQMVQFQFDQNLHVISTASSLSQVAFDLIGKAEAQGWTAKLVIGARLENPGNAALQEAAQALKLAPITPTGQRLERLIKASNSYLQPEKWRTRLAQIEGQVCRIETPSAYGTGFLLGPDVVITNYHVLRRVIEQAPATAKKVRVRFDYREAADGTTVYGGTAFGLAADWLLDGSPASAVDDEPEPKSGEAGPEELDYALVRLDQRAGSMPAVGVQDSAAPRGWIALPDDEVVFAEDGPLFIMQHPEGHPLKLALDTEAIIGVNGNGTRVRYRTNTEKGSSGSPCFDADWNLVALHHSGDPNFDTSHKPEYNEGIPFSAIMALLTQRGKLDLLGE